MERRTSRGLSMRTHAKLACLEAIMSITVAVSPTQLSWNDFLAVDSLPDGSGDDAQTATEMPGLNDIRPVLGHGKFSMPNLTLTVGLDRSQTMVLRTATKTAELLKHDQGHYDIT